MNDKVTKLLAAARPAQFTPGSAIDETVRERELAKAFDAWATGKPTARQNRRFEPVDTFRKGRVAVLATTALAVILVVTAIWVTRTGAPGLNRHRKPVVGSSGLLLDAAVARPQSAAVAEAGIPAYYVIADHFRPVAEIRDAITGHVVRAVALPAAADPKLTQIAAAGDGRSFVLALFANMRTSFYRLTVGVGGRSATLVTLPVRPLPSGAITNSLALSPDGTRLAVAVQFVGGQRSAVEVVTLATGAARTWTTGSSGLVTQLSWTDNGRDLGFFWQDTGQPTSQAGLRVLDTAGHGSNLLSGRLILPTIVGGDVVQSAVLSPDGSTVDASVTYGGTGHISRGTVVGGIVEVSARTGRPLRLLLAERAAYSTEVGNPGWYIGTCQLVAGDATGDHLLVSCAKFGRLDRARFTPLPGSPPQTVTSAAW